METICKELKNINACKKTGNMRTTEKIRIDINYIDEIKLGKGLCINENYKINIEKSV
ncbi:hypothetical protein [Tepidibacter hydrothermalis]|uniref:Uncharacterized protein n=1 Tax=Tepidibacter hydrothermalis TaxID=3036126 RepID=A0ABY8EGA0_9FIRM|nr:hypothetical protein [Tepidibacter hydrothermalis]WFD11978.1 hypothetical protein P4S50_07840 [Tepidibacter hydrothermalis]